MEGVGGWDKRREHDLDVGESYKTLERVAVEA